MIYLISILIITPTLLIDTLHKFAYIGLGCFISVILALISISSTHLTNMQNNGVDSHFKDFNVVNLPGFFGSVCLCLGGVTMIIPIRSILEKKEDMRSIFKISFLINAAIFMIFTLLAK